jgi:hypothetical protein
MDDLISYNTALEYVTSSNLIEEPQYQYNKLTNHKGPLKKGDPGWKHCSWNVEVEWVNGEHTYETLDKMIGIDKEMCYRYAKENNLIGTPGWGKLNAMDRKMKLIERNVNMASIKSSCFSPIYQYGIRVPRNHKEAVFLDHECWAKRMTDGR